MSRRRVQFTLDSGNIKSLSSEEIRMILRAADELIGTGGRSILVKILKGSKDKKVLEHKLDLCPAYGFYKSMTMTEISYRVDWMIEQDYIDIDYADRLPMIVFTDQGWSIEKETLIEEFYEKFRLCLKENRTDIVNEMKDYNRQVVFGLLEKIRDSKNKAFIPILEAWKAVDVRKVRQRISSVQKSLESGDVTPVISFRKAVKSDAATITHLIHDTVMQQYPRYYPKEVADFFCLLHSKERILEDIGAGNVWLLMGDDQILGTGTIEENHMTRVYVPPKLQHKGYGSRIMQELEMRIAQNYDTVGLDASLPACRVYEKRGYHTIRHDQINLMNDVILVYDVMEKQVR